MLFPNAPSQLFEQSRLPFWYRLGQALFHVYLIQYEGTVIVPRLGTMRFAGDQANLHNGSQPCITARAVLSNEQLNFETSPDELLMKIYSYYFEEVLFKFSLSAEHGATKSPWLESDHFPPLPPRQAIMVSKALLMRMLKDHPAGLDEPEFDSCALKRNEHEDFWYYDVSWMIWPPDYDGDRSSLNVPVMLNGHCPPYEVFSYEDRQYAWKT